MPLTQGVCSKGILLPMMEHTWKIALYTDAATINRGTLIYIPQGEVEGEGYTAGGKALEGCELQSNGITAWLTFDNPSWPDSTITARGALIYNASMDNAAWAVWDFGEEQVSHTDTFALTMPPNNANDALIRLG